MLTHREYAALIRLLPPDTQPSLPWPRCELRSIDLPAGAGVPDGALQKRDSDRRSLLMRSISENPLMAQVATLSELVSFICAELDTAEPEGTVYLQEGAQSVTW